MTDPRMPNVIRTPRRARIRFVVTLAAIGAVIAVVAAITIANNQPARSSDRLLSGGSSAASNMPDARESPAVDPQPGEKPEVVDYDRAGIHRIVTESDAAVIATVSSIGAARWNSADGAPWSSRTASGTPATGANGAPLPAPLKYRDITITVNRVLYADTALPATDNSQLTVRTAGDGTPTGALVDGGAPDMRYNQTSGDFSVGDSVLLILKQGPYPMRDGPEPHVLLEDGFMGSWTLREGKAISIDPRRTVDATALIDRIQHERTATSNASQSQDDTTAINPLGEPPPPETSTTLPGGTANPSPPCYGQGC